MKMKKVTALLLAAAMVFGALSGCGSTAADRTAGDNTAAGSTAADSEIQSKAETSSDKAGQTKYPVNENGYPDLGGETISIWFAMTTANTQATNNMENYTVIQDLEKKFNVKFEFIHPPVGQEKDNFTIMMADGTLPDMIFCGGIDNYYPGGVETALADEILYDYTDYIGEEYTPNFYNLIKDDEFLKKAVTDDQGRIIRLGSKICGSEEADLAYAGPLIRKDMLEATGMDVPTTIDEWTEMLAAMKKNGVEYPLALDKGETYLAGNSLASAFGIDADSYYLNSEGKVTFGPYEPGYKDYMTLLNSWYKAGYINPDFTTQTADEVLSMMSADRIGSTLTHLYPYGMTYYVTTETVDPARALVAAPIPVLKEGDTLGGLRTSSRRLDDHKYITVDALNKEACIALLDALYLTDINNSMQYGTLDVTYKMEDNEPVALPRSSDTPKEILLQAEPQQMGTYEDTDLNYILTKKYNKGVQPDALKLWKQQGTDQMLSNFILLNTDEAEIIRSYGADIETYVKEMTLKFIMGVEPLENFPHYQENLKSLHIEELIGIEQSAMDRYLAR